MPVGDTQRAVASAARRDGLDLTAMPSQAWLNGRGHADMTPGPIRDTLARAFRILDGDEHHLQGKQRRALPNDLVHLPSRTMVEVDEFQHFTTFRARTLDFVGDDGFLDIDDYRHECDRWSARADGYRAAKKVREFPGDCSRGRQRAYFGLVRDLVVPTLGWRLVRIPAPGLDGEAAYARSRDRLMEVIRSR